MIKILLIEDDLTMISLLKMLLELDGYKVVSLSQYQGNIDQLVQDESPDLIFLDVHLGQQNGLDVIKDLKKNSSFKDIKVIMTSGMTMEKECKKAGADDFILKPYMPDELLGIIKDYFPDNENEKFIHHH